MKCLSFIFIVCSFHGFVATKHLIDDFGLNHPKTGQHTNYKSTQHMRYTGHAISRSPVKYLKESLRHVNKTIEEPMLVKEIAQNQHKRENITKELRENSENDKEIRRLLLNKIHQSTSHNQAKKKKSELVYSNYSFENKQYDVNDDSYYYGDYAGVEIENHSQKYKKTESPEPFIDNTRASKVSLSNLNDNLFQNESVGAFRTEAGYTHDRDICKQYNENLLKYWNQLNKITPINSKKPSLKALHNVALIIEAYLQHHDDRVEKEKFESFDSEAKENKNRSDNPITEQPTETTTYKDETLKIMQDIKRKKLANILDNILLELNLSLSMARARYLHLDKIIHIIISNLQYKTNLETDKRCRKAKIKTLVEYVESAYNVFIINSGCIFNTDTDNHSTKVRAGEDSSIPDDRSQELSVAFNYFDESDEPNDYEEIKKKPVTSDDPNNKIRNSEKSVENYEINQQRKNTENALYNEVEKLFDVSQNKDTNNENINSCRKIAAKLFMSKIQQMVSNYLYDDKCEGAKNIKSEIVMDKPELILKNFEKIQNYNNNFKSERSRNNGERVTTTDILEDIIITLEDVSTLLFSQDDASVNSLKPSLQMIIEVLKNKLKDNNRLHQESTNLPQITKEDLNVLKQKTSTEIVEQLTSKPVTAEKNKYIQMIIEILNNNSSESATGTPTSSTTISRTTNPDTNKQHNPEVNTNEIINQKQHLEKLWILPLVKNWSSTEPSILGRRENDKKEPFDINWLLQLIHYSQQNPGFTEVISNEYKNSLNDYENNKPDQNYKYPLRDRDLEEIAKNINNPKYEWFIHFVQFIKDNKPDFVEHILNLSKYGNENVDQSTTTVVSPAVGNKNTPLAETVPLQYYLSTTKGPESSTVQITTEKSNKVTVNNIYTSSVISTEGKSKNVSEEKTKLIADLLINLHKLYEVPELTSDMDEITNKEEVLINTQMTDKPTESLILHTTEPYKPIDDDNEKLNSSGKFKNDTHQLLIEIAKVFTHHSALITTTAPTPITNEVHTTDKPVKEMTESLHKLITASPILHIIDKYNVDDLNKKPHNNEESKDDTYQLLINIAKVFTNYSDLVITTVPTTDENNNENMVNVHTTDKPINEMTESLRKLITASSMYHTTEKYKPLDDLNTKTNTNNQSKENTYHLLFEIAKVFTNYSDFITTTMPTTTENNSENVPNVHTTDKPITEMTESLRKLITASSILHTTEKYKSFDELNKKPNSNEQIKNDTRQLLVDIAKVFTQYSNLVTSTKPTPITNKSYSKNVITVHTTDKSIDEMTTEDYEHFDDLDKKLNNNEQSQDDTHKLLVEIAKVFTYYNNLVTTTVLTPTTNENSGITEESVEIESTTETSKEPIIKILKKLHTSASTGNVKPNDLITNESYNIETSTELQSQPEKQLKLLIDLLMSFQRTSKTENGIDSENHYQTNVFHQINGPRKPSENKQEIIVDKIKLQPDYSDTIKLLKALLDAYSKKQANNAIEKTFNISLFPSDNYDSIIHQLYESITKTTKQDIKNNTKTKVHPELHLNDDINALLIKLLETDKKRHEHNGNEDILNDIVIILMNFLKGKRTGPILNSLEDSPTLHDIVNSTERPAKNTSFTVDEVRPLKTVLTSFSHEDHSGVTGFLTKEQPENNVPLNYDYTIGKQNIFQLTDDQTKFLEDLVRIKAHLKKKDDVLVPMNNQGPHLKTDVSLTPHYLYLNPYTFGKYKNSLNKLDLGSSETSDNTANDKQVELSLELKDEEQNQLDHNSEFLKHLQVSKDYILGSNEIPGNVKEAVSNKFYTNNITDVLEDGKKDVELTYLLKQPRLLIYQPHVLVKQRVPYDFYVKNIQNKLDSSSPLVNNTAKLVKVVKYDEAKAKLLYSTKIDPKPQNIIAIDTDTNESNSSSSQEVNGKSEDFGPLRLFNVPLNITGVKQTGALNAVADRETMSIHSNYTEITKHESAAKSETKHNKGLNSFVHHINTTVYHKASNAKPINITVFESETHNLGVISPKANGTSNRDLKINNTKLVFDVLTNQTIPPPFHTIKLVKENEESDESYAKVKGLDKL